jgi:hypothetical protein
MEDCWVVTLRFVPGRRPPAALLFEVFSPRLQLVPLTIAGETYVKLLQLLASQNSGRERRDRRVHRAELSRIDCHGHRPLRGTCISAVIVTFESRMRHDPKSHSGIDPFSRSQKMTRLSYLSSTPRRAEPRSAHHEIALPILFEPSYSI